MNLPVYDPENNHHKLNQFKFYRAVCLIVAGYNKEEISTKLKVTPRTLVRWFQEPAFQESLKFALGQTYRSAIAELSAHSSFAAKKLIEIIDDDIVSDRVRLEGIRLLFDIIQKAQVTQPENTTLIDMRNKISYFHHAAELTEIKKVQVETEEKINQLKNLWNDFGMTEEDFPKEDFDDLEDK